MLHFCKTCTHVRTAEELGVVSPITAADELFCGLHPPQAGEQSVKNQNWDGLPDTQWIRYKNEPICLPPCNDGQGYRNMACWTTKDKNRYATLAYTADELEMLYELMSKASIEWKRRNADIYIRCQQAMSYLRSTT
jgi:hypothetical protein